MKKTICLASIVILIITAFPILTVSASVAPDAAPPDSLWTCTETNPGACPSDANPLVVSGSVVGGFTAYADLWGKMICEEPGCNTDVEVYVSISFNMEWSSPYDRTVSVDAEALGWGEDSESGRVACGSGTSGSCGGTFYFAVQTGQPNPITSFHVMGFVRSAGLGTGDSATLTSYEISISGEPKNCDSEYKIEECELGEIIDPTKELAASLPTYTLEPGQTYRMKLSGAWQAEEAGPDLTAVEASFDGGATWMTLVGMMENDMVECVTQDPESPDIIVYFTAPSATMKIRVKDTAGQYADNTGGMTMDLCVATLAGEQENCAGQFTVGTTVITTGTFSALIERPAPITVNGTTQWATPGEWYVLTTSGGPWHDGSDPASRYDIQMTTGGEVGGEWQTPEDFSLSNCMTSGGNYISVYFQGSSSKNLMLRVHDTGGNWLNNSGTMSYTITKVDAYEPYVTGCALPFDIGNFVEEREVYATNGGGIKLLATTDFQWPAWPFSGGDGVMAKMDRYFVLETTGAWTQVVNQYGEMVDESRVDADMKKDDASWSYLPEWPEAYCVEEIDPVGHVRVYFDATKMGEWRFRVHDTDGNLLNNFGTLGYRLYYGLRLSVPQDPGELPETGFCDQYYERAATGLTITLYGKADDGIVLPLIAPEVFVAIEVVGGPWDNNGTPSYATAISDNNGSTYTELTNYSGVVCKETGSDANHPMVYLVGKAGKDYRVRVHDPGGNFADNDDSIQMIVYAVTATDAVDPWHSCANNYTLTEVPLTDDQRTVGGSLITGKKVDSITPGTKYALEITNEGLGWMKSILTGEMSFKAEVTDGAEFAWFPEATWIECAVEITEHEAESMARYRIYFTAAAAKEYRIKVATTLPTAGWIRYRLYKTTDSDIALPPDIYIPPGNQQQWGGCNMTCYRPAGLFTMTPVAIGSIATISLPVPDVGGWVDYVRCATFVYLSWCQEHTNMLISMVAQMQTREPFGMLTEVGLAYQTIKDDVEGVATGGDTGYDFSPQSYVFQGGGTGGDSSGFPGLFPELPTDSPWITGQFDFVTPLENEGVGGNEATKDAYVNYCQSVFISRLGLSAWGLCAVLGLARYSIGDTFWVMIQFAADVALIIGFMFYIKRSWIDTGAAG